MRLMIRPPDQTGPEITILKPVYIGHNLVRLRKEADNMTQRDLAIKIGRGPYHQSYIAALEANQHKPTFETLEKIARALNTTIAQLIAPEVTTYDMSNDLAVSI